MAQLKAHPCTLYLLEINGFSPKYMICWFLFCGILGNNIMRVDLVSLVYNLQVLEPSMNSHHAEFSICI